MARARRKRDWYSISVDTLRGWILAVVGIGLLFGGYKAYGLIDRHYLEGKVARTIQESRELLRTVRLEPGAESYRSEYETARESLREAQEHADAQRLEAALSSAERSRMLLTSVLRLLHRLEASGEAQFITVQGEVEYRRGERGEWRSARSRDVLYAGDYVKTSAGAATELMAIDGTVYTVRADSVVLIGRSNPGGPGGVSTRSISLDRGWVDLSTSLAQSHVKTPEADASVAVESTALVGYDESRRMGRFAAYRGSMNVSSSDGQSRRVRTLEHVVQTGNELSEARRLPAAPLPVDPVQDLEIPIEETNRLVLNWQPVPGAKRYALQVARNRLFVNKIIDVENRASTQATLGLQSDGTFVWRVAAMSDDGVLGPWSDPRTFRVTAPLPDLEEDDALPQGDN